jgi:hypothetical protein
MFSGFATRFTARMTALVLVASMLTGCAEFNRRGGIVAQGEDYVLFVANTKSHRLFRSYLLVGVLLAAARQAGHNDADKLAIEANMRAAVETAYEAYHCLYPDANTNIAITDNAVGAIGTLEAARFTLPAVCQFFDEKMARLDYALFRLALTTLFNAESNASLSEIRDKLMGKIPVLSDSVKAAIHATKAVNQATSLVDDLLNLSFSSAGPVLTLLPLYRDSLELNMWLIIDNLTKRCQLAPANVTPGPDGAYAPSYAMARGEVCATLAYALQIMNNGNGDLRLWRDFAWNMNYATFAIEAYTPHFFLVTKLMWRSCQNLLGDSTEYTKTPTARNKCQNALNQALAKAAFEADLVPGEGGRLYSASLERRQYLARIRSPQMPSQLSGRPSNATDVRNSEKPGEKDLNPTGSIGKPKQVEPQ